MKLIFQSFFANCAHQERQQLRLGTTNGQDGTGPTPWKLDTQMPAVVRRHSSIVPRPMEDLVIRCEGESLR